MSIQPCPTFARLAALLLVGAGAAPAVHAAAHAEADEPDNSFTVLLNQDAFFGFYPSFNGLLQMSETMDFSFYGILWTKPAFGLNPTNTGDDLWTEFGAGVNLKYLDGQLLVKPQLGITNGSLLSGGELDANGNVTGSQFADGVVPSLTVNFANERWEAEWYSGYYLALANRSENAALDFLHLWLNAGYRINPYLSVGAHYEWLDNTRNTYPGGTEDTVYRWFGGYVQFSLPKGMFARFTAGTDDEGDNAGDFYKLNVGMTF